jgi:hypothetical protein
VQGDFRPIDVVGTTKIEDATSSRTTVAEIPKGIFVYPIAPRIGGQLRVGDVMTKIAVITSSTRQERFADRPAAWVTERLRARVWM